VRETSERGRKEAIEEVVLWVVQKSTNLGGGRTFGKRFKAKGVRHKRKGGGCSLNVEKDWSEI